MYVLLTLSKKNLTFTKLKLKCSQREYKRAAVNLSSSSSFFFFFFFAFNSHHDVSHFLSLNLSGLLYYCSVWPWPPFPFIICLNYQQTKIYTICFLNVFFFFFVCVWGWGVGRGVLYFIVLYQSKLNLACIKGLFGIRLFCRN